MSSVGRTLWGRAGLAVLGLVVILGVGAFGAWRYLSNRTGEAAIAMLPADAQLVLTIDTAPADTAQAALFKKIGDALEREGVLAKLDELLKGGGDQSAVVREIRPYLTKSLAVGLWFKEGKPQPEPSFAALIALTDAKAVEDVLAKRCTVDTAAGTKGYKFKDMPGFAGIVNGYLVISNEADLVRRVERTAAGDTPSVAGLPAYATARKALPADANIMAFLSPEYFAFIEKLTGAKDLYQGWTWGAYGVSLRNEGLSFDFRVPGDAKAGRILKAMAQVPPIGADLLKRLPGGAYGMVAASQPSAFWVSVEETLRANGGQMKAVEDGIRQFEKETGLSLQNDVLPAFAGEAVVAVYPAAQGKSIDVVLEFTDQNGANPAGLAEKVRLLVEKKSGENGGKPVRFVSAQKGGATVWTLDPQTRQALLKAGAVPTAPPVAPGGPPAPPQPPASGIESALKDKTVAYAVVGKSLIIASSTATLDQAVAAYNRSGSVLAGDRAFAAMEAKVTPQAQQLCMVDIGKVMSALKPTLESAMKDSPVSADDIVGMFGDGSAGIMFSARYDGTVFSGTGTVPLDYEKLISVLGKGMKAVSPPPRP